jgi:hypothetical protein
MIVTLWLVFLFKVCLAWFSVGHFAYVNEIFRHVRTVTLPYIVVELHNDESTLQCLPVRILALERLEKCFIMAISSHLSLLPPPPPVRGVVKVLLHSPLRFMIFVRLNDAVSTTDVQY